MQQQGGNPGLPAEFPHSSTSPAQQRPPYTVPGSIPRPGPPSWQGPPPGTQFRPQGVPQPSSGAPPTLANALSNPISPFQSGSYQRPVAGRPPGPPAVFQPSQPSLGAPPPFQPSTFGGSSQADGSWSPVSNPNSASVGFSPKASSTGGSPFSNVSPVPSTFGGSIPPPPTSSSLGSGFPISSAYPASSTPVTSFPRPPQVASGPGARPPFYAPGPYNLPPTGHQFSSAPPQQPPPSSFGPSPPSFGAPPQFGTPTPPQYGGTAPSQGYYSTGPPPPPPPPTTPGIYAGEGQQVGSYGAPPLAGGYGGNLQQPAQGLVEDFQSLSLVPLPGSVESAVDPGMLPRPLDSPDDVKSTGTMNCNPRYLRLSTNAMPNSHSLVARWHLPLGAVVHPLAEAPPGEEVPVVNFVGSSIVRCRRCRAYINPYVMFTDGGRRWRCNVCVLLNEVPIEYFCSLDENGRRRDADERPELSCGSVEFVAQTEYMVRPPMPPVYFFLIDVSISAVKSGMLKVAAETIKASLDKLPGFPRTQIGFLTFDSMLHFYNLKSSLMQPQMMVVADLDDPFLPLPDDLLVNLSESRVVVDALLDSLPSLFEKNISIESALGPALKATFMIMSQLGGKLLVFQSTLPSLGVGRLKLRGDDPRIYGTEKEYLLRGSEEQFYKHMAADFSKYQIGVNIYAFGDRYTDLASLGTLAKYTGGQVCYYPGFQAYLHGEKFSYELARDLSRETAWEAVMRIRCGKGIRFSSFHGHFMLRSSDLMALPAVDCDKAFSMQLTLEDTLLTTNTVYFQVALLFTSSTGERRIRVHTMATPVVSDLGEMYRAADVGAITSIMSRLGVDKSMQSKLEDARQTTQQRLHRSLREYRNMFAVQHRTSNRLLFPESLRLLPLYTLAICKNLALRGGYGDTTPDERSAMGFEIMTMSISRLLKLLYPAFFRIDEFLLQGGKGETDFMMGLPKPVPLASERLDPRGAFLLNDGLRFVLWLGKVLPDEFVKQILGPEFAYSPDLSKVALQEHDSILSKRLVAMLRELRKMNPAVYQQCILLRQGEQPREGNLVLGNLVEDQTGGLSGYADWIVQTYRHISQKAS